MNDERRFGVVRDSRVPCEQFALVGMARNAAYQHDFGANGVHLAENTNGRSSCENKPS